MGKIYFKKLAVDYCTKANQKLNKKYQNLTKYIVEEKSKSYPDVNQYQELLNEIENYKAQGIIIILNKETTTKYFLLQQKQNKRQNISKMNTGSY